MKAITVFVIIVTLSMSCASYKNNLIRSGESIHAIENAIRDFSNKGKSYKRNAVFTLMVADTFYKMILEKVGQRDYKWKKGIMYQEIIGVSIIPYPHPFLFRANVEIEKNGHLPTRYIEKDGKLFYWWDPHYPLTEETLAVYRKYNLLKDDEGGLIKFLDIQTDHDTKSAHYYFCRNDLSKYKRIDTNTGMGYYDPPKGICK